MQALPASIRPDRCLERKDRTPHLMAGSGSGSGNGVARRVQRCDP